VDRVCLDIDPADDSEQVITSRQAVFNDPPNASFTVTVDCEPRAHLHDWDEPTPAYCEPDKIQVAGLTRVGGIDTSFRNDGRGTGDAIAAFVILSYPDLSVSS
jgi:hypothetical protein